MMLSRTNEWLSWGVLFSHIGASQSLKVLHKLAP